MGDGSVLIVMAGPALGPVPAIHALPPMQEHVDGRDEHGHDDCKMPSGLPIDLR
jgi:hypothetical protein